MLNSDGDIGGNANVKCEQNLNVCFYVFENEIWQQKVAFVPYPGICKKCTYSWNADANARCEPAFTCEQSV